MYTTFRKIILNQTFEFDGFFFIKINSNQAEGYQNGSYSVDGCVFNFLQDDQVKTN